MRAHPAWSYAPYRPPFIEVGDIYICRVVPSEQGIHFEWLPCEGAVLYTVQYRLRGEGDFITAGETVGTEFDISALDFEQDYEFYVTAGSKKSRVRLARTGKKVGRNPGESVVTLTKKRVTERERSQYYHELQTKTRTKKIILDR